jgi:hypothetical protein
LCISIDVYQKCSGIPTLIKWGNYKLQVILTASSTNYNNYYHDRHNHLPVSPAVSCGL